MSNSHSNKDQSVKIELTPTQQSPGTANPNDFTIGSPTQKSEVPGHGQRGDTLSEQAALYREGEAFKPTTPIPTPNKL